MARGVRRAAVLAKLGYQVVSAHEGEEAVAKAGEHIGEIGLVILDMVMPGANGREVLLKLKPLLPRARFLISSGISLDHEASQLVAQGCDGFLQKPFTLAQLSTTLQTLLDEQKPPSGMA